MSVNSDGEQARELAPDVIEDSAENRGAQESADDEVEQGLGRCPMR